MDQRPNSAKCIEANGTDVNQMQSSLVQIKRYRHVKIFIYQERSRKDFNEETRDYFKDHLIIIMVERKRCR